MNPQKPVRVVTSEVDLIECPVCHEQITGTVEVAVHLGNVTLDKMIEDGGGDSVEATVSASTEMRSLDVRHRCGTAFRGGPA
jgi:hypothetical protein